MCKAKYRINYYAKQAKNGRKPVSLWLDGGVLDFIDAKRGDTSRAGFIEIFFAQFMGMYR